MCFRYFFARKMHTKFRFRNMFYRRFSTIECIRKRRPALNGFEEKELLMVSSQNDAHVLNSTPMLESGLLASKLKPRLTSPSPLPRPRVIEQLQMTSSARLVLVHAPAGFGKTTTMMQYFAQLLQRRVAAVWLTVDSADNEVARFLSYVVGAFRTIDPSIGQTMLKGDSIDAGHGVDSVILNLASHLSAHPSPFVLFIDDFEVIQNPTIFDLVRQIIDYLPQQGQVVIGSRNVPDLGIGRLRAHGQLLEVAASELRFTPEETASFLRQRGGLALNDAHIRLLQKHTEGWAAALWLVSLALKGRENPQQFIETFSGSNTMIMDYLVDDVLAGQPEEVRSFLLQTGILNELSAPLCNSLTGRTDAREMLTHIERANLFLVPQDSERRWYRYHKLFSEFLRAHLQRVSPNMVSVLHRKASEWYLAEDRAIPAIEHAFLSGDIELGLALLSTQADELLWKGRVRLLARWFDSYFPTARQVHHPKLVLTYAWALTLTHRYQEAMQQLERLRQSRTDGALDDATWAHVKALQAFILAMSDSVDEALKRWEELLGKLSPHDAFSYGIFFVSYAFCLIAANRFSEARKFLDEGKQFYMQVDSIFNIAMAICFEGSIDLAQGRLRSALSRCRAALASVPTHQARHVSGTTIASAFLAVAMYEANQLDEAERMLTAYLPLLKEVAAPDQLISSYVILVRTAFWRQDVNRTADLLTEMEHLGHQQALPRLVANARMERARQALHRGDLKAAREHLESACSAGNWRQFKGFIMQANDVETPELFGYRLEVHAGHGASVIPAIKQALKQAEELMRYRRALKLKILLAEALHGSGEPRMAMRYLREALEFASVEGFIRTFIDEGTPVLRLVVEFRKQTQLERGERVAPGGLVDFVDRLLDASGYSTVQIATPAGAVGAAGSCLVAEALSERETQVLALLALGYQNRIMAEKLFVSEATIKAHLRNINAKLSTHSRTHAIAVARQLGLVQ